MVSPRSHLPRDARTHYAEVLGWIHPSLVRYVYIYPSFPGRPSWLLELPAIADTPIIMAVIVELLTALAVMFPLLAEPAAAGCIADIEHVVLFMQGAGVPPDFEALSDANHRKPRIRSLFRHHARRSWVLRSKCQSEFRRCPCVGTSDRPVRDGRRLPSPMVPQLSRGEFLECYPVHVRYFLDLPWAFYLSLLARHLLTV